MKNYSQIENLNKDEIIDLYNEIIEKSDVFSTHPWLCSLQCNCPEGTRYGIQWTDGDGYGGTNTWAVCNYRGDTWYFSGGCSCSQTNSCSKSIYGYFTGCRKYTGG